MKKFIIYIIFLLMIVASIQITLKASDKMNIKTIAPDISFRGIYAWDNQVCWVSGSKGSVYKTENQGSSWEKVSVPDSEDLDFRDIHLLSDKAIILMSAGPGEKSRIYKSMDKGKTWRITFTIHHPEGFLNSMAFWNEENGIAAGDPIQGKLYVIKTSDRGETWKEINTQNLPSVIPGECGFAASGTCIAVSGSSHVWIGTGGPVARIFSSSDQGKNWSVSDTPIIKGESSTGIFSVYFMDKKNGIIVGGDYQNPDHLNFTVALSEDRGKTWTLADQKNNPPFQSCVIYVSKTEGSYFLSTGPKGTYYSKDKGASWQLYSSIGFHSLSLSKSGRSIWMTGADGRVATMEF